MKKEAIKSASHRKYGEDAKIDLTDIESKIETLTLDFRYQPNYGGHDVCIIINGKEMEDVTDICKPGFVKKMVYESKPLLKVLKKFFSEESVDKIKKDCPMITNNNESYITTGDFTWNSQTHNLMEAEIGIGT
jgi:hypothetical protein